MKVFVSHAGPDIDATFQVDDLLRAAGIKTYCDRRTLQPGESFLEFMETGLSQADYCLLLWSQAARDSVYVKAEWLAALNRMLVEQRNFLVVARLENIPVPTLVNHRLYVDLFPDLAAGVARVVAMVQHDQTAALTSGRVVAPAKAELNFAPPEHAQTVYVTSQLWEITTPVQADPQAPVAWLLEQLTKALKLPTQGTGPLARRYSYRLRYQGAFLDATDPVGQVPPHGLLELITEEHLPAAAHLGRPKPVHYLGGGAPPTPKSEPEPDALTAASQAAGLLTAPTRGA